MGRLAVILGSNALGPGGQEAPLGANVLSRPLSHALEINHAVRPGQVSPNHQLRTIEARRSAHFEMFEHEREHDRFTSGNPIDKSLNLLVGRLTTRNLR